MMGKAFLFLTWAGLLGLSLYCAYRTGNLQNVGRDAVATVKKVTGQVFQRPENLSVYELILERDRVFNGDYISTGPGASAEVVLLSSKSLFIGENSLVQLTFGSDTDGLGSDIVTLLKGDVIARGETGEKTGQKKLRFNVGGNSVKNIEAGSGVQISKKVDESKATIKVVAGNAEVTEQGKTAREIKINEVVQVVSESPVKELVSSTPVNIKTMTVQRIDIAPENIALTDRLIKDVPRVIKNMNMASLQPIEDSEDDSVSPSEKTTPVENPPPVEIVPEKQVDDPVTPKKVTVVKPAKPFTVFTYAKYPGVFKGNGIYVVKKHRLLVKVTGKPTTADLLSIVKKYDGDFLYKGKAEALSGGVNVKQFFKSKVIFAVNKNGVQKIDAALVRTRPAAIELLKDGGYSIFTENVNVLNVGH